MKYRYLIYNNNEYALKRRIEEILSNNGFYWLIDAEFEDAEIEIENDTIIWKAGNWYSGTWKYGIWLNGNFNWGTWENGIFEGGDFNNGTMESGIFKDGNLNGGEISDNVTKK